MNSQERREARYKRRVARRKAKKREKFFCQGGYDQLFSFEKLYNSFYQCREGVRWKKSIQTYEATLLFSTFDVYCILQKRRFAPFGFLEFDIMERGKFRHIRAVQIRERCIQRILCDEYLIPRIEPLLIYDNGASIKNKGTSFSIRRMKCHLQRHFRKYGNTGYIFQYDFSSYFDNIDHRILLSMLYDIIDDPEIFNVTAQMIVCFGDKGLGLGSQVSQICAVWYPTLIDRYFKENLGIQGYGRYNDDGYAICKTLEQAKACQEALIELCGRLHIKVNKKKMRISRLNKTFIFLKKRFLLTDTGKIIVKIDKSGVTRARRRLKKLSKKINTNNFTLLDFTQSYRSWVGMAQQYDNFKIIKNFETLYYQLLEEYNTDKNRGQQDGRGNRIWTHQFNAKITPWKRWETSLYQLPTRVTSK